jgi:uncharacterized coiled-coil protein SlyX
MEPKVDINQLALKVAAYQSRITVLEARAVMQDAKIAAILKQLAESYA